jgi:hypothetical protein
MIAKRRLCGALISALQLAPSWGYAGFEADPQIMTTLSLTLLSATTGAGMGGMILAQDRERHLREHAVALLDALAIKDKGHLLELAAFYVEPARREAFAQAVLGQRRRWMRALEQLVRGQRAAKDIDRALVMVL